MKLLRVVLFGTAALLGATCAASSSRDENAVSANTDNDDLMRQGHHDEGGSAHCSETGQDKPLTSFVQEWAMTPAHFASYVGGHGMCPDTPEGCQAKHDDANFAEEPGGGDDMIMTTSAAADATSVDSKQGIVENWTFDAGSPEEQATRRWVALVKGAAREANGDDDSGDIDSGDEHEEKEETSEQGPMRTRVRGWKLGPNDPSLESGLFLRNLNMKRPATLEVTEVGDVLLSAGMFPDRTQEPLWAYRSTGASGVDALGCAVESLWQRVRSRDEIRVNLSVKNGRWRVGRGRMCTLGRSPAPEGSLRRFLPWDERGLDITEGELYLEPDATARIRSEYAVLWHSKYDEAGV